MVNSSIGGFLLPLNTIPAPLEGQELNRFIQPALVSLTGLTNNFVIPGNQSEPPNVPDAGDAWMTFYYERITADKFPYIVHLLDSNDNGYDQLQRHEMFAVNCDFFDSGTNGLAAYYATLLRDNLAIPQNKEFLLPQNFNLMGVGGISVIPIIFKTRWQYRERFVFYIKRNVVRNYAIQNIESAQFTFKVGNLTFTEVVKLG